MPSLKRLERRLEDALEDLTEARYTFQRAERERFEAAEHAIAHGCRGAASRRLLAAEDELRRARAALYACESAFTLAREALDAAAEVPV
jgi:hypothetical protein